MKSMEMKESSRAMKNVPARPLRSSVELAAISKYLEEKGLDWDASVIAQYQTYDGFSLMKDLQREGWEFVREDLDTLDEIVYAITNALEIEEVKWVAEHDIYSKALAINTRLTIGIITDIYIHAPACYLVKTPDCALNSHCIINFEDAVVAV